MNLLTNWDSDDDFLLYIHIYIFFSLASEPHTSQPSQFSAIASKHNFVTSSCECEVLNQRLVRINDSKSLKELETTALQEHNEYWTSLR